MSGLIQPTLFPLPPPEFNSGTFPGYPRQRRTMYKYYGVERGQKCGDCQNLRRKLYNARTYFKCRLYGDSCGAGTDFRLKWTACGAFKQVPGRCSGCRHFTPDEHEPSFIKKQVGGHCHHDRWAFPAYVYVEDFCDHFEEKTSCQSQSVELAEQSESRNG